VYLTHPVETRNFQLDVTEGADDIVLEMDLIGMLSEERKEQHPYLEQQVVDTRKHMQSIKSCFNNFRDIFFFSSSK
jgi:hypothetical protein